MKQYCRYCANALDYNGEAEDFLCSANAKCGDYGAGRFYKAEKAKRVNRCRYFKYNPLDVFYTTYGEREYHPRGDRMYCKVSKDESEQIEFFADSSKELAEMCGVTQKAVLKGVERYAKGMKSQWRRIEL